MSKFATGSEAAKERAKSTSFPSAKFWRPKDGSVDGTAHILRFLTDYGDWVSVDQHAMVPTKQAPMKDGKPQENWPRIMGCVCHKTTLGNGKRLNPDCYVCDNGLVQRKGKTASPGSRTWALACIREEVKNEAGALVGYRDQEREVAVLGKDGKPTGESTTEKDIVFVNMGWKNFFAPLEGYGVRYGTVIDRDYWIKRIGDDTQTTYQIVPNDPQPFYVPVLDDQGKPMLDHERNMRWEQDGMYDLRRPEVASLYETRMDIEEEIERESSEDFIGHWFDPNYEAQKAGSGQSQKGQPAAPVAPPAAPEPNEDALRAMRERVTGYAQPSSAPSGMPSQPVGAPQPQGA